MTSLDLHHIGLSDIEAHLLTLSPDVATEWLVALLRVRPDASVRAVDTCKVARGWSDQGVNEVRLPLGRAADNPTHVGATPFVGPLGSRGPHRKGEWMYGGPGSASYAPDRTAAKAASDDAWAADGWVLAGGGR